MNTAYHILGFLLWAGLSLLHQNSLNAQDLSKSALTKSWRLEKYYEEGEYYPPEKKEIRDFIKFEEDMTFTASMEGESYAGTWMLNTNGAYVEMKYTSEETEKMRIKWVSAYSLVVIFDADYYRYTEVHYFTTKP